MACVIRMQCVVLCPECTGEREKPYTTKRDSFFHLYFLQGSHIGDVDYSCLLSPEKSNS